MDKLRVVLLKPSKYLRDGTVERFRRGFMPNATLPYLRSLTPAAVRGHPVEVQLIDEYVDEDLVRLDGATDFAPLRRKYFGCDQVPLPPSAALSAKDEASNRAARSS